MENYFEESTHVLQPLFSDFDWIFLVFNELWQLGRDTQPLKKVAVKSRPWNSDKFREGKPKPIMEVIQLGSQRLVVLEKAFKILKISTKYGPLSRVAGVDGRIILRTNQ